MLGNILFRGLSWLESVKVVSSSDDSMTHWTNLKKSQFSEASSEEVEEFRKAKLRTEKIVCNYFKRDCNGK